MKIVHVYAQNIQMFVDAVNGTNIRLNASRDINYLIDSLQRFNARDVMGLIVFANPMTKRCLKLIEAFDKLFIFKKMPIIVISDNATELYEGGFLKIKNSRMFLLESEENSISDLDVSSIFTTLLACSDELYDLSVIPTERKQKYSVKSGEVKEKQISAQLTELLNHLKGSEQYALE